MDVVDLSDIEVPPLVLPMVMLPVAKYAPLWTADGWTRVAVITRNGRVYRVRFGDNMLDGNFSLERIGFHCGLPVWKHVPYMQRPLDRAWTPLYSAAFWMADVVLVQSRMPVRVTFAADARTVSFDGEYGLHNHADFVAHFIQYLKLCVSCT